MSTTDPITGFLFKDTSDSYVTLAQYVDDVVTPINNWAKNRITQAFGPWSTVSAMNAQTGMVDGDTGWRSDIKLQFIYIGGWRPIDGINSIRALGVTGTGASVDAGGLISLSGTSTMNISNAFTSDFSFYKIILDINLSAAGLISAQLSNAGTADTGANYDTQISTASSTTASASQGLAATNWAVIAASAGSIHRTEIELFDPAASVATTGILNTLSTLNPMTTAGALGYRGLLHRSATAYDGMALTFSQPATGTIKFYGYSR